MEWIRLFTQWFPFRLIWKNLSLQSNWKFKYILDWFNSSIEITLNYSEILQTDSISLSSNKKKNQDSIQMIHRMMKNYSIGFNIDYFINLIKVSFSSWIKSSIGFQSAIEYTIRLFQISMTETYSQYLSFTFRIEMYLFNLI